MQRLIKFNYENNKPLSCASIKSTVFQLSILINELKKIIGEKILAKVIIKFNTKRHKYKAMDFKWKNSTTVLRINESFHML